MSELKKNQLREEYGVRKKYIIPSIYGPITKRRKVERKLLKDENYFKELTEEIGKEHKK